MSKLSAAKFSGLYDDIDIVPSNTDEQGYIMLNVEPIPIIDYMGPDAEDDYYFSPTREFVQGGVGATKAHLTLGSGILLKAPQLKEKADTVLSGWQRPRELRVSGIESFPSTLPDEDYACIVAVIEVSEELQEGHDRLRMLPHIDFFPVYKPHVTIAYVKATAASEWVDTFEFYLLGATLTVKPGLNYGKE